MRFWDSSAVVPLLVERDASGTGCGKRPVSVVALAGSWHEVRPSEAVRQAAQRLLRLHPRRALDALQAAAAVVLAEHDPITLTVVCLDGRLAGALRREGFAVAVPL